MLSLVLIAAFFVGASATNVFMDDAFAGNHDNNGVDPCEKASPDAKGCANSPNSTSTDTCDNCRAENQERNFACIEEFGNTIEAFFCLTESHEELKKCIKPVSRTCQLPPPPSP